MIRFFNLIPVDPDPDFDPELSYEFDDFTQAIVQLYDLGYDERFTAGDKYFTRSVLINYCSNIAQGRICADYADEIGTYSQAEIDALLNDCREEAPWGGKEWTANCPLVVVADAYEDGQAPTGNVISMSPATDRSAMESLAAVGLLEFEIID